MKTDADEAKSKISEGERSNMSDDLTLQLLPGEMPFALTEKEKAYTPDDWAWLFLRLNEEYKKAYAERERQDEDQRLAQYLEFPEYIRSIKADRDGSCSKRFGLAAWLNPHEDQLPKLKNNGSWFFPLKRLVVEDYYRTKIDDQPYTCRPNSNLGAATVPLHIIHTETPFGYGKIHTPPTHQGDWGLAWVAIDCSIPPAGQLSSLKILTSNQRKHLRDFGFNTRDNPTESTTLWRVEAAHDVFRHMVFMRASGATSGLTDLSVVWRAVCVDTLGSTVSQLIDYSQLLKQEHLSLVKSKQAKASERDRFKNNLHGANDKDGIYRHGGNYLKALHIIAELTCDGFAPNQIADMTKTSPGIRGYAYAWQEHFHDNIERYVEDGRQFIQGDYRWLIHAQKPDLNDPA